MKEQQQRLGVLVALLLGIVLWMNAAGINKMKESATLVSDFALHRNSVSYTGKQQGLTVIGAGFPRTGTKSIEKALHMLGHRVYDFRSSVALGHVDRWEQAAEDWKLRGDLTAVTSLVEELEAQGYTATMDIPMNLFALAFAEIRPKAKVLFSVRDTEEQWLESMQKVIPMFSSFIYCRPYKWIFPNLGSANKLLETLQGVHVVDLVYPTHLDRPLPWFEIIQFHPIHSPEREQVLIELHKKFQKELERKLPKQRLLVFNVKQGWAPLIPFLGIKDETAVTDKDFPNLNDAKTMMVVFKFLNLFAFAAPVCILSFLWVLTRILHTCIRLKLAYDDRKKAKND